jgi:hypothetical protein
MKVYELAIRAQKHFGTIVAEDDDDEEEEENISSDHA